MLKRGDKVYTEIVSDCSAARLQSIIRGKASIDSVIYSDGWKGYKSMLALPLIMLCSLAAEQSDTISV
jgi:transposase-like protein